jgi:hypothetical protein
VVGLQEETNDEEPMIDEEDKEHILPVEIISKSDEDLGVGKHDIEEDEYLSNCEEELSEVDESNEDMMNFTKNIPTSNTISTVPLKRARSYVDDELVEEGKRKDVVVEVEQVEEGKVKDLVVKDNRSISSSILD